MLKSRPGLLTAAFLSLTLLHSSGCIAQAMYRATIQRTAFGIPHIEAKDYAGVGYGLGYAYAQDNVCLLADSVVTVNGERSRYFGPDAKTQLGFLRGARNIDSDFFFKSQLDTDALRQAARRLPRHVTEMLRGYAAGYNRYLRDTTPSHLPVACRGAAWVRPITLDDELRLADDKLIQDGLESPLFAPALLDAAPPGSKHSPDVARLSRTVQLPLDAAPGDSGLGSNGWAFGRSVTRNHSGILLGNPHMFWSGSFRFYEAQLTIPGHLNVMGAYYPGSMGIGVGFNENVAWTATIDTGRHFTLFQLTLDPSDPTTYIVDGKPHQMTKRTVAVSVLQDGKVGTRKRVFYSSVYGPILVQSKFGISWTARHAYAIRDADQYDLAAMLATPPALNEARDVAGLRAALDKYRAPYFDFLAADRAGNVLYADISPIPDITPEKFAACAASKAAQALGTAKRLYVLDGSRSSCNWGLMPATRLPQIVRTDFVANSNDSYWLANPNAPSTSQPPIVGETNVQQGWRTRAALLEIGNRLAGTDGLPGRTIDPDDVYDMLFRNWNFAASLFLDDILADCRAGGYSVNVDGKPVAIGRACDILAKWDRHMNIDSRGAVLFQEVWSRILPIENVYAVPFDPADPVHTPRGLSANPATVAKIREAIGEAAVAVTQAGFALDAPLGQVQIWPAGDERIPIDGGSTLDGVLNAIKCDLVARVGCVPEAGSSYIQIVTFSQDGPVAKGVLTYSESSNPQSPHYADQTREFSKKVLVPLPFSRQAIHDDKTLTSMTIEEREPAAQPWVSDVAPPGWLRPSLEASAALAAHSTESTHP